MKVIDVSWPISQATTEYKSKKTISIEPQKNFDLDKVRDTKLCMGTHTGTHVDAPAHFLKDGKTIDEISIAPLIGHAQIIDLVTVVDSIKADDLIQHEIRENEILLLRTANSAFKPYDAFEKDFIYVDPSAARYLVEKKVKAVGIDYLGIERGDPEHTTHITFFNANIPIIEGLRLGHVQAGHYFFICLPLALVGVEAAPARAILMTE